MAIDPQIDFMSPNGVSWPVVGESVTEHNLVPNLVRLFEVTVAISPHKLYGPQASDLALQLRKRASIRSFSPGWRPISVSNPICGNRQRLWTADEVISGLNKKV